MNKKVIYTAFVVASAIVFSGLASAQSYPEKSIRMVVGTPAGAQPDFFARLLSDSLQSQMGQPVIVENRAGAGGVIAANLVRGAQPDGYTLFYTSMSTAITSPLTRNPVPYDVRKDFTPLAMTQIGTSLLVVHPSIPAKTGPELIAYIKANPNRISFGSAGVGTVNHLVMEMLKRQLGLDFVIVPFNGAGAAINSLLGGHIQITIADITNAQPHIDSKAVSLIAQYSRARSPLYADTPTMAEAFAMPELAQDFWLGVLAPSNLPAPLVQRLREEIAKAINKATFKEKVATAGMAVPDSSVNFGEQISRDWNTFERIIKEANISVN